MSDSGSPFFFSNLLTVFFKDNKWVLNFHGMLFFLPLLTDNYIMSLLFALNMVNYTDNISEC